MRVHLFTLLLLLSLRGTVLADRGPPKLLHQPPEQVWLPLDPSPQSKPVLKCVASDNVDSYEWRKNGDPLNIGGALEWERPGQTGSIVFTRPSHDVAAYYQCFAANIFGTAVSLRVHVQIGVLEHFPSKPIRRIVVTEGESLTLDCHPPRGTPPPTLFWLYRDTEQDSVIETIRRRHIAVDAHGKLHFSAVQQHDGRPNLLYECAATSPVLHGEYRSGDQVQLEVRRRDQQTPLEVHAMYTSPSEVTVKAGSRLKLQCIFGGFPVPTVLWSKLDGEMPKDRMKTLTSSDSDFGKSLIVDNVHPDDAGRYECQAQDLTHTVNVRVMAAPFWHLSPPEDVTQSEDHGAELHCSAGGSPPPIIRWSMNGVPLHQLPDTSRRMLLDGGRLLRIPDLHHEVDTGVYQCNASNPLGYVYANAYINVRAHAPRFMMPVERIWKVVLRTEVHLNCDVDAAPEAVVRWVDADDKPLQIIEGKSKILPNHTLIIYDVNSDDEGLYYCNVSNKYGINRATNQLRVYKPTYFVKVPTPKTLFLEAGRDAELLCEAVTDSRLDVEYKWTINGQLVNNSKNFEILPDRLLIKKARGRHSGSVDCAAVTDVDLKVASVTVTVRDVPSNPDMEVPTCSERKAVVKWKASSPHGDPIRKYLVEVQTDFKKGIWELLTEETNTEREDFEIDVTLTPWVNYTFRVIAVNTHGRSDVGLIGHENDHAPVARCQTRPSFPYTNPSGVWAAGTQPDNLVIHWNAMDKYYWNAKNLNYLIRYKLNEPNSAWTEFLVEDPLASSTTVRELPTFREFLVQVRAVNSKGPSILEPEIVKGFSGEDVPSIEPGQFSVVRVINYTSVEFSWIPVEKDTVNGYFEGYEIEYWKTDEPKRRYKAVAPAGKESRIVTSFVAHTNYSAIMRTKNRQYSSSSSRLVRFETPEGVPSRVANLKVFAVGAHSILVSWEKPPQPNGLLQGYFLSFDNDRNETEETYVLHKQLHYLHERSIPETAYKVSVWAETSAGEGPRTTRPLRTWSLRPPDAPYFKVSNVTLDSMTVTWLPSNGTVWKMPGASFYVNYTLEESGEYKQSTEVFLPNTQIFIDGLMDASKYIMVGVAKDGPGVSRSEPIPVFTQQKENASHLNQESLRTAAWFISVLFALAVALTVITITCCCEERKKSAGYSVRRKELEVGHQLESNEEGRRFLEYNYGYKS